MFYYIELDNEFKIKSFGESTSMDSAFAKTQGKIKEITQQQYLLLSACRGNVDKGIYQLKELKKSIRESMLNEELSFG